MRGLGLRKGTSLREVFFFVLPNYCFLCASGVIGFLFFFSGVLRRRLGCTVVTFGNHVYILYNSIHQHLELLRYCVIDLVYWVVLIFGFTCFLWLYEV
jgi:hypothetical protein